MSISEIKETIVQQLDEADEKLIRMIYAMMEVYQKEDDPVISYDIHGNPRRASELKKLLDKEVVDVKKGNYLTMNELEEKSKEWIKPTQ